MCNDCVGLPSDGNLTLALRSLVKARGGDDIVSRGQTYIQRNTSGQTSIEKVCTVEFQLFQMSREPFRVVLTTRRYKKQRVNDNSMLLDIILYTTCECHF